MKHGCLRDITVLNCLFQFFCKFRLCLFQFIYIFRHFKSTQTYFRARFIHNINCLIRKKTIIDITIGVADCCLQCFFSYLYFMMFFISGTQTLQNLQTLIFIRFFYRDWLESSFQCRIFFNIFAVFHDRCGTDQLQFSSCKGRLQNIRRIHRSFCTTRTNDRMHFIQKQNDITCRLHLLNQTFHTFFEFSAVF